MWRNRKTWPIHRKKKQVKEKTFKRVQMMNLADKDSKSVIINMYKEQKETMFNNLSKGMKMAYYQGNGSSGNNTINK